jgi:predicted dehydrogenase
MTKTLKLGVVGCGWIASVAHLPCYRIIPNAEVVAVMDAIKERAEATARSFHIKKWYSDYEEMLKDGEIEAVDICSPPNAHAEQALKAAEAGKHILCEKPISTNLDDASKLESEVRKADVKFMTGFTYRFHPLVQKAKDEVAHPKFLRISYSFRPGVTSNHWVHSFSKSGGFLVEQAVHWFDLFRWFSGKARSVYAKEQANPPFQNVAALISYQNNELGLINFNSNSSLSFLLLTIENSEKSAMIKIPLLPNKRGGLLQVSDKSRRHQSYFLNSWSGNKTWSKAPYPVSFMMSKIQNSRLIPFYKEIGHFVQSVLDNNQPNVSLQDGLESLKLAVATRKSIDLKKEIQV